MIGLNSQIILGNCVEADVKLKNHEIETKISYKQPLNFVGNGITDKDIKDLHITHNWMITVLDEDFKLNMLQCILNPADPSNFSCNDQLVPASPNK